MQEKSACGVGFVVSRIGKSSHEIILKGLDALKCVEHRGACAADNQTGDGAGLMADIPFALFNQTPGSVAIASLFVSTNDSELRRALLKTFEDTFGFWAMKILAYREVPVNKNVLGPSALQTIPKLLQAVIRRPEHCNTASSFDKSLYLAKQATLTRQRDYHPNPPFFFASLSTNTIVYKGLTTAEKLGEFYLDLKNPSFESRFAMFHRRFSTNTVTSWDKAQPFRLIGHNGEINTIAGNRSWAYSCEKSMGLPRNELLTHEGISDSGSLNEMVEALMYRSSLPHIEDCLALMMPPADKGNSFYKFWGRSMEPWDGPALITFSDGQTIGARLDRNGFRPCRWAVTDDMFYLASEAGVFHLDESKIAQKGALRAGSSVKIDIVSGKIDFADPSQSRDNFDYQFDPRLLPLAFRSPAKPEFDPARKFLFHCTDEEFNKILVPMIREAKEPIGSMGDTARLAILSNEPRSFFDYFYQNFAQVTNPPLDYLREKMVTDLSVYLGCRPNIFAKKELIPPPPALELSGPILSLGQMEYLDELSRLPDSTKIKVRRFNMVFNRLYGSVDFRAQLEGISNEVVGAVKDGTSIIVLSDRTASWQDLAIPALVMLRSVIAALDKAGLRLRVSVVIDSAQIRTTHQVAATISFGASAICPYLALQIARHDLCDALKEMDPDAKEKNLIKALEMGLLKVMSKMGISVVRSYQGSKLFTIVGFSQKFCDEYFSGVPTLIGGLGLDEIVQEIATQTEVAERTLATQKLEHTYQLKEHPRGLTGEKHSMTNIRARLVHDIVREEDPDRAREAFQKYLNAGFDDEPVNVRHLLQLKAASVPANMSEVQANSEILKKFGSGAMSFGAISAESQRDIILAMRGIGGRSNSGEGGENPYFESEGITASTKQIASGRFGVTATYLVSGQEFQIKMAQGAKPGEGGQLMAPKVNEDIAKARHSMTHVDLISPPPMHDIYSIEDLKQLIYELKQIKPDAQVSVKLVSGANIGTIAVGVAKAGSDIIHIAGNDGGTGAATISSMKHAGLPFEFGLLEVHRALVENGLRDSVKLRTDGGLHTGKDIVLAAIMGAEEFDFGKLILISQGCVMARICEKNTCPTGIATHDPKFKEKYKGTKDHIIKMLQFIAEDVRENLSQVGCKSIEEVVGRTDLLMINERHRDLVNRRNLDLGFVLSSAPRHFIPVKRRANEVPRSPLDQRVVEDCRAAIHAKSEMSFDYQIFATDRAVLAGLSGLLATRKARKEHTENIRLKFHGSAGQGFGVFLTEGVSVQLFGEANDSVCKTMSGGSVVIRPHPEAQFHAEANVIVGNCALYGATGGVLYVNGLAGDRFAVRNSGALAVVEGTGLHACEYMTNGTVVILGPVAGNVGSGMTGGALYLFGDQEGQVNSEFLVSVPITEDDEEKLGQILRSYLVETDSAHVRKILVDWENTKDYFKKYLPKNLVEQVRPIAVAKAAKVPAYF